MITRGPPLPSTPIGRSTPLHVVLAQLSFSTDVPQEDVQRNPGSVWSGLLCTSFEDDDLFFDAEQDRVGIASSMSSLLETRGGSYDAMNESESQAGMIEHETNGSMISESWVPSSKSNTDDPQNSHDDQSGGRGLGPFDPLPAPPPPQELPLRFLRAGKGDPVEGWRRYQATLSWRQQHGIDHILTDPHPNFDLIKRNYPHYYHLRGRNGEPVFFEQPPKTNLQTMKDGGVVLEGLLHHYAMVTEFQWQFVERDDFARSITVLDLEGMRMRDFVGECVEYVRRCSEFTGQHYPERAGFVFVINVPGWFAMIWNVVKPMVDEVTLKKINILRGKNEIFEALLEKIPIENIPPEYGGQSVPLGESPEEHLLRDLMHHNNALASGDYSCGGRATNPPCPFCSFVPARSY